METPDDDVRKLFGTKGCIFRGPRINVELRVGNRLRALNAIELGLSRGRHAMVI
jgi:hypothetical protein